MSHPRFRPPLKKIASIAIFTGIACSCFALEGSIPQKSLANSSMLEFRWDESRNYKKLYYWQSSSEKRDRATYYLVIRPGDRRTAILKLTIKIPNYFDAKITPRNFSLCKVQLGGMLERTKCIEKIPAVFEVSKDQTSIEIFPDQAIPSNKKGYAVIMKIFNPNRTGMFQFDALAQTPGDLPISYYLGSWSIDIE